jgi:uncharacterized membrane protein
MTVMMCVNSRLTVQENVGVYLSKTSVVYVMETTNVTTLVVTARLGNSRMVALHPSQETANYVLDANTNQVPFARAVMDP